MFKNIHQIHFIGIGGIGVSALARFFLKLGKNISGSDMTVSDNTVSLKSLGVKIFLGHSEKNLEENADLVIYSPAVPQDNPEIVKAKNLTISLKSYPEMLGEIMSYFPDPVAVSGTNGKTTTTSLIGLMLEKAGRDPTVVIGGKINSFNKEWDENLRFGKAQKYFVAEGCEYKRGMMNLNPKYIVLTNVEEDHLDYFKNLEDIKSAFKEYVLRLSKDGALIYNEDDPASREVVNVSRAKKISYSAQNPNSDLFASRITQKDGKQEFNLIWREKDLGVFEIYVPGIFNIYNCLAASALILSLGIDAEVVKRVLTKFYGTWRRFERVGFLDGAIVISDYAHHPTAIRETIKGAKKFYPGKKILVVFQPHQKDRTVKLFDDFVKSFEGADEVIISEIYSVEGRNEAEREISSLDLVSALKNKFPALSISYSPNLSETKKIILEKVKNFDIILIMGAGDIYKIANEIIRETRP